jgi:hypothetical protein
MTSHTFQRGGCLRRPCRTDSRTGDRDNEPGSAAVCGDASAAHRIIPCSDQAIRAAQPPSPSAASEQMSTRALIGGIMPGSESASRALTH